MKKAICLATLLFASSSVLCMHVENSNIGSLQVKQSVQETNRKQLVKKSKFSLRKAATLALASAGVLTTGKAFNSFLGNSLVNAQAIEPQSFDLSVFNTPVSDASVWSSSEFAKDQSCNADNPLINAEPVKLQNFNTPVSDASVWSKSEFINDQSYTANRNALVSGKDEKVISTLKPEVKKTESYRVEDNKVRNYCDLSAEDQKLFRKATNAVLHQDDQLERIIDAHPELVYVNNYYQSDLLSTALAWNKFDHAENLISKGAQINVKNVYGEPTFWRALSFDALKFAESHGADLSLKDIYGNTFLHKAVSSGAGIEFIKYLIEEKGFDVNAENNMGESPLFQAIVDAKHNVDIVECLISKGAKVTENSLSKAIRMQRGGGSSIDKIVNLLKKK